MTLRRICAKISEVDNKGVLNMFGLKDTLLEEIKNIAKKYDVEQIKIFGSRARGDYKEKSDIDLAFFGGDASRFILDIHEETSTLLLFDVVDLNRPVSEKIRQAIENEGIVIYEKI